ncbi:MAG: phosphatase PAP2 family protein [Planctomycetia bacterium]
MTLALLACCGPSEPAAGAGPGAATASAPGQPRRDFLAGTDGTALWRATVAGVAADLPIARAVPPDFLSSPPGAGLIESAWIDPLPSHPPVWPPTRQRLVVRFIPATAGAWVETVEELQTFADGVGGGGETAVTAAWQPEPAGIWSTSTAVEPLPPIDRELVMTPTAGDAPPWAGSRFPRLARAGYKVAADYRSFYSCESLVCLTAAFGAGALMANTGFDTTMQNAWQRGVEPTGLGTFFSGCKDIGEGRYALPVFGLAAATGLLFEGNPAGDAFGEWGSRSLRIFVVGAPPLYAMQWATGGSRPNESSAGSQWDPFNDNNGVSGHAFVGAIPFLAAADMVEHPLAKGTLYVCSTFVGFSRMTDDAHYPSQVFLGWYLAWASARAVNATEMRFAGVDVRIVPLPMADLGGAALDARW